MFRSKIAVSTVLGATLLVSLVLGGSALAQRDESVQLDLTQSRDSGVSGKATFTDVEDGVKVELRMQNLPEAGIKHINHIHGGGTCADDRAGRTAPVTIPLNAVVADADGTGSATTTIKDVTLDELLGNDQHRFILVHAKVEKGQGVPPGISCADLPQKSTTTTFGALPSSGGVTPTALLVIALVLLTASMSAILVVRRNA